MSSAGHPTNPAQGIPERILDNLSAMIRDFHQRAAMLKKASKAEAAGRRRMDEHAAARLTRDEGSTEANGAGQPIDPTDGVAKRMLDN